MPYRPDGDQLKRQLRESISSNDGARLMWGFKFERVQVEISALKDFGSPQYKDLPFLDALVLRVLGNGQEHIAETEVLSLAETFGLDAGEAVPRLFFMVNVTWHHEGWLTFQKFSPVSAWKSTPAKTNLLVMPRDVAEDWSPFRDILPGMTFCKRFALLWTGQYDFNELASPVASD